MAITGPETVKTVNNSQKSRQEDPAYKAGCLEHATKLEREAHHLRAEQRIEEAFESYDRAAALYRDNGEHLKAALCFASAATAWNIRVGWQPLHQAASRNLWAAREALKARHYDYARSLFRDAALLYEKEGDAENYSLCFLESQRANRKRAWELFLSARDEKLLKDSPGKVGWNDRFFAFFKWLLSAGSSLIWGYGERPFRTSAAALFVIVICAAAYYFSSFSGHVLAEGTVRPIQFAEALYLSVITFSTVGYGDYLPLGWVRMFSSVEALSGIILAPLFLVALTRRYLRMYQ